MTSKTPSIVLIDIETSPILGYTWTSWDADVLKILRPSMILSVSWKTLHSPDTIVKALPDYKGYKAGIINDRPLVEEVWKVLDEADVVIGHHSDAFDLKKLNSRFVYYGLNSPSFYQSVDTKKVASKYFRFDSNSLNNLGVYLNVGEKVKHQGFDLWVNCMEGDKDAWAQMKEYNTQDVVLLEKVYLKLRPFMQNHPDLNVIAENGAEPACSTCSSHNVQKRGFSFTKAGKKQRYQCNDCFSWSTGPWQKNKVATVS